MNVVTAERPAPEKSAVRKIKRRLISFSALLMVVNFIDRTNVGFAAMRMSRDIAGGCSGCRCSIFPD
jgi:hypothetical protein